MPVAPATTRPTPKQLLIGAQSLSENSYYINIARKRPRRKVEPAKANILLVEDDNTTRSVLAMVLSRTLGCTVRQAADGAAFVNAITQPPVPDVLILDLELPGEVNGFRILDKIRKHPRLKAMPVIIFSGHTEPRDLERAIALGADAYLSKPAKVEAIIETLKVVLSG